MTSSWRLAVLAWCCMAVAGLVSACGGGSTEVVPSATPDSFESSVLSALTLQPFDVPDVQQSAAFFAGGGTNVSFNTRYGDPSYAIQSSVTRIPDPIDREQHFFDLRRSLTALIGGERNFALEGSELAFAYKALDSDQTPHVGVIALTDSFIVQLTIDSNDRGQQDRVLNDAMIAHLMTTMFSRVLAAVDDPASVTPVASAPASGSD
jgi:hypothetical protein